MSGYAHVRNGRVEDGRGSLGPFGHRPVSHPTACQLPDQSTIVRVRPSLTDGSRPRGRTVNRAVSTSRKAVLLYPVERTFPVSAAKPRNLTPDQALWTIIAASTQTSRLDRLNG
jgi:hypothetical protein